MSSFFAAMGQFFAELRRRNVYRVAGAYLVAGFVVLELADMAAGAFGLPGWFQPLIWVITGLGFPIALVLAWALEVTPDGVRPTPEAEEGATPPKTSSDRWGLLVGIGTIVVALGLGGAWWLTTGSPPGEQADSTPASPAETEQSVAVLPFEVTGGASPDWEDGMVTMLSTGLDGAAGLRAISDRRVFAVWEALDTTVTDPAADPALAAARRLESAFAVTGSAVTLGNELQLAAEVWETESDSRIGHVEVTGQPGQITALADKLTRQVIAVLAEETVVGSRRYTNLASVTTSSVPALKRYLAGERAFRNGQYGGAAEQYEAAIAEDSTFALAYLRLSQALSWSGGDGTDQALRQAYRRSDQLPRREARLVEALYIESIADRDVAGRDSLRRLSEDYPDDPSVWFSLGETLAHTAIPGGWPEAEQAFQEAAALDPGVVPYHHHLVHFAIALHRDSALAAQRLAAAPGGPNKSAQQVAFDLVFGSSSAGETELARLDTLPWENLEYWAVRENLWHPTDRDLEERVLQYQLNRLDLGRDDQDAIRRDLVRNAIHRGQIETALQRYRRLRPTPNFPIRCFPALHATLGLPVPDSTLRAAGQAALRSENASPTELMCAGLAMIELGQTEQLPALMARLREQETVPEGELTRTVDELRGYQAFRAGNLQEAAQHWIGANEAWYFGAISRGDLYRELGQFDQAEDWYLTAWIHPVAHERLGRLYEEMDRPEKAAAAYERFIQAWKNADPALQPRVEQARERLQTLMGEPGRVSS